MGKDSGGKQELMSHLLEALTGLEISMCPTIRNREETKQCDVQPIHIPTHVATSFRGIIMKGRNEGCSLCGQHLSVLSKTAGLANAGTAVPILCLL